MGALESAQDFAFFYFLKSKEIYFKLKNTHIYKSK